MDGKLLQRCVFAFKYQSITKVYQCCADIFNLNIFLDKHEMQEFVRSSAHHAIFIIAMTHEQYFNVFLMKEFVDDIYNHLPVNVLVNTTTLAEKGEKGTVRPMLRRTDSPNHGE